MSEILLVGSSGKLGSEIRSLGEKSKIRFSGFITRHNPNDFKSLAPKSSVIIDVSTPDSAVEYMKQLLAANQTRPLVIGSTGWTDAQKKTIDEYSKLSPVVIAPNFSVTVTILNAVLDFLSRKLDKNEYSTTIHDLHHSKKRDAPSGTAKLLAATMKANGFEPEITSERTGDAVGTHEVAFESEDELLLICHEAKDRTIFARGAILAAQWCGGQQMPGIYSMADVLSVKNF